MRNYKEIATEVAQELRPLIAEIVGMALQRAKQQDALMDSAEVMAVLSISRPTLQRWLASGKLAADSRVGRKLLFKRSAIENLLKRR